MSEQQKKQLEQQLWKIADALRGKMDADDFKDYMLGFIFYKYLSEKMENYANQILKEDDIEYTKIDKSNPQYDEIIQAIKDSSIESLGFFLLPDELFKQIANKGKQYENENNTDENTQNHKTIIEDLTNVFKNIETSTMGKASEDDFDDLFSDVDLTSTKLGKTVADKNKLVTKILTELDKIDFDLQNVNSDLLGDAYEYLISKFASGAGKKAGEFYTPQQVSKILAKIVTLGKKELKNVYDPTCGSGSLLLRIAKEINPKNISMFYGQEMNRTTYNLARMNMILHDIPYHQFDIKNEDTLQRPQHKDLIAEAIAANPPFSAEWSADIILSGDDRFAQYGKLAPKSKADFAFVQHMIHHLSENGALACVLPHGVLFRGAAEYEIRKYLIAKKNYIDAIIGLPANIFYGTSIPTCILVCKKCRENPDDILFIDASQHFEKRKNQNELTDENVNSIVEAYKERKNIEKYSYVATLKEVEENDYNLNIPRYVDTFEDEEQINIDEIASKIQTIDEQMKDIDSNIINFCNELGIKAPF